MLLLAVAIAGYVDIDTIPLFSLAIATHFLLADTDIDISDTYFHCFHYAITYWYCCHYHINILIIFQPLPLYTDIAVYFHYATELLSLRHYVIDTATLRQPWCWRHITPHWYMPLIDAIADFRHCCCLSLHYFAIADSFSIAID